MKCLKRLFWSSWSWLVRVGLGWHGLVLEYGGSYSLLWVPVRCSLTCLECCGDEFLQYLRRPCRSNESKLLLVYFDDRCGLLSLPKLPPNYSPEVRPQSPVASVCCWWNLLRRFCYDGVRFPGVMNTADCWCGLNVGRFPRGR